MTFTANSSSRILPPEKMNLTPSYKQKMLHSFCGVSSLEIFAQLQTIQKANYRKLKLIIKL